MARGCRRGRRSGPRQRPRPCAGPVRPGGRARRRPGSASRAGRGSRSNSSRRIRAHARRRPGRRRPAPSSTGRPISTPRAPSASAIAMSSPRRTPPSTQTSSPAVDRGDDLGEHVDAGRDAIELARAVVADDDAVDAVLDREPRVLGGEDALEHDRQRRPAPDRGEVGPGQGPRHGRGPAAAGPSAVGPTGRWVGRRSTKLPSDGSSKPDRRSRSR